MSEPRRQRDERGRYAPEQRAAEKREFDELLGTFVALFDESLRLQRGRRRPGRPRVPRLTEPTMIETFRGLGLPFEAGTMRKTLGVNGDGEPTASSRTRARRGGYADLHRDDPVAAELRNALRKLGLWRGSNPTTKPVRGPRK